MTLAGRCGLGQVRNRAEKLSELVRAEDHVGSSFRCAAGPLAHMSSDRIFAVR
jgi:hypothetical protein